MQYAIRTPKATDIAAFFSAPESDLAANGLSMTAEGDRVLFDQDVLDFLRAHRGPDDDGYVSEDEAGLALWIEGDGLRIETVN